MNFYLSSYKLGSQADQLRRLAPSGKPIAFIPNAMDFIGVNLERLAQDIAADIAELEAAGLTVEPLDLRTYFNNHDALTEKLNSLGGIFIRGGNVFVLRQAMQLSGLDRYLTQHIDRPDFLYAGYSAGCCVLSQDLRAYATVDDPKNFPYPDATETIWEGLGFLNYAFIPHYRSDHHESAAIELEIQNCIEQKILFRAFRDGEVEVFERK